MPARQIGRKVKPKTRARSRPAGRWGAGAMKPYDPEAATHDRFMVPTEQYTRRFTIAERTTKGADGKPLKEARTSEFEGVLLAPIVQAGKLMRMKPVHVPSFTALRQLLNSQEGRHKRMLEAGYPGIGDYSFDTDVGYNAFSDPTRLINDPVPLMNGPYYKQLYWYDYLAMHSEVFDSVNKSPLAASAVKIMTRFVIGRGISFHIKEPRCEAIWTEFWERNDMRTKVRQAAR